MRTLIVVVCDHDYTADIDAREARIKDAKWHHGDAFNPMSWTDNLKKGCVHSRNKAEYVRRKNSKIALRLKIGYMVHLFPSAPRFVCSLKGSFNFRPIKTTPTQCISPYPKLMHYGVTF